MPLILNVQKVDSISMMRHSRQHFQKRFAIDPLYFIAFCIILLGFSMSEESQLPGERGTGTISGFRLCTQAVRRESRGAQSHKAATKPFRFKQRLFDHIKAIQIDQTYRSHF